MNGLCGDEKGAFMRGHAVLCGDKTCVLKPTYNTVISYLHWNLNERLSIGFYVTEAYGGIRSIINGKTWMKAMKVFRGVAAALL